ncbi:hypothetical protein DOTSEDRAFT_55470 [Dothistroma septosporum NZE10]|uniref:J domain-containing protein n=1 Tax=Dothistroma septosporum (strain NZE10 / CBS 128990) TaxID=675120 RepID=N1PHY9_DOTSN|nr:hypothetical protein DOTSEDRAFT_55470 [Dothistroma septosporum NZE10]
MEQAADTVRERYEHTYAQAVQEERDARENLADWRSFNITITQQEQERKAKILQEMQEAAEVEARRQAAETEAIRRRLQGERIEKDRVRREERQKRERARRKQQEEQRREQARRKQQEQESRRYHEWKSQNAGKPPSQGKTNPSGGTRSSTPFDKACAEWRAAVEVAFRNYAAITIFPQPPVSGTCSKANCGAEKRALRACACDVQKALRVASVDLKKARNGWHPDRFSGVVDESKKALFQGMAKEVFQVVSAMYSHGRG